MMSLARLAAFLLVVAACGSPPQQPQAPAQPAPAQPAPAPAQPEQAAPVPAQESPAPLQAAGPLRTELFGGERWGFVEASSANGRIVVLRRFHGAARPRFGHHGETADEPEVTVFDRVTRQERTISEIIDIDPTRRYLLLIGDEALWLVDAEKGSFEQLQDVDMEPDGNACLPPRQASFSSEGNRVAWVTSKAGGLTVRDLATGTEWHIAARQRMWRGWPEDEDRSTVVIEVPAGTDWPEQRTSCACRWCGRFAMSYGMYGWDGPAFTIERVSEDGKRENAEPPDRQGEWHGRTTQGCELKPQRSEGNLEHGPWHWQCP